MFKVEFYIKTDCAEPVDETKVMNWFVETMEGCDLGEIVAVEVIGVSSYVRAIRQERTRGEAETSEEDDAGDEKPGC